MSAEAKQQQTEELIQRVKKVVEDTMNTMLKDGWVPRASLCQFVLSPFAEREKQNFGPSFSEKMNDAALPQECLQGTGPIHTTGEWHAKDVHTAPVTLDPWAHRSAKMMCRTCMWYVAKAAPRPSALIVALGRCRRHAPSMNGYPVVYPADWCGDHKLDETKS
jgi:hypothetical protein